MPLKEELNKLVAVEPTALPFLSAYVDLSPELEGGTRPYGGGSKEAPRRSWRRAEEMEAGHVRHGITVMRELLRERDRLLPLRGPERESFDKDAETIIRYLTRGEFDPTAQGVAIFACAGEGFWEVVEIPLPVETQLVIDRVPLVYPLARLDDDYARFALCIADSQIARVYVVALGQVELTETVKGPTINYKMTGGLSQRRIQERIDNAVDRHIREVAALLEKIVVTENVPRIVLGGDAIMLAAFKQSLSAHVWERVVTFDQLDIRLPTDEAIARAMEAVQEAEQAEGRDIVRQALDATLAGGLGAAGAEAVAHAMRHGAADTLVLSGNLAVPGWRCAENTAHLGASGVPAKCPFGPGAAEPADLREELTALALQTGAHVEFVEGSEELERMGHVAALLRWRPDDLPPSFIEGAGELTSKTNETNEEAV